MKNFLKGIGACAIVGGISLYSGARYQRHKFSQEPYQFQQKEGVYFFVDVEKEKAIPAADIVPTYNKLDQIKKAIEEHKKKLEKEKKSLDAIIK